MKIGDLVEPKKPASYRYPDAIVVSLNPFVLVSWDADMIWKNEKIEDFNVKRKAPSDIFTRCMTRFKEEEI